MHRVLVAAEDDMIQLHRARPGSIAGPVSEDFDPHLFGDSGKQIRAGLASRENALHRLLSGHRTVISKERINRLDRTIL
jgi:hypothetical protein